MTILTRTVTEKRKIKAAAKGDEWSQSREKPDDLIFLSNKVRIKGPTTVTLPPFPIPALICVAVMRNEKVLKLKKKKSQTVLEVKPFVMSQRTSIIPHSQSTQLLILSTDFPLKLWKVQEASVLAGGWKQKAKYYSFGD